MRGQAASMTVLRPRSPEEACAALARDPRALPLAGGTDLLVSWNMGLLNGRAIVDLSGLSAWRRIEAVPGALRLGSLATHAELRRHPAVRRHFPLLAQACGQVGAAQIQNRGTLGGNLANASPAADAAPALAAYEAEVLVAGPRGASRRLPVLELFAGPKRTTLAPGELIEAVDLPRPARPPDAAEFRKLGTRRAQAISKSVFAGLLWLKAGRRVEKARLAFGSMAPTARRLRAAEAFLEGRRLDKKAAEEAARLLERDLSPIDDIRSTKAYRLAASRNILLRFLKGEPA